jgi:hypothetical protein
MGAAAAVLAGCRGSQNQLSLASSAAVQAPMIDADARLSKGAGRRVGRAELRIENTI